MLLLFKVALPDGRKQIVTYRVSDPSSGYVADVRYEGEASFVNLKSSYPTPASYLTPAVPLASPIIAPNVAPVVTSAPSYAPVVTPPLVPNQPVISPISTVYNPAPSHPYAPVNKHLT